MSGFINDLKNEFSDFLPELRHRLHNNRAADIQDARCEEQEYNIALATIAMLDAGLKDDIVIQMLQKYWDLRRSEATYFLEQAHGRLTKKANP